MEAYKGFSEFRKNKYELLIIAYHLEEDFNIAQTRGSCHISNWLTFLGIRMVPDCKNDSLGIPSLFQ